jgi:hypothetical protein
MLKTPEAHWKEFLFLESNRVVHWTSFFSTWYHQRNG